MSTTTEVAGHTASCFAPCASIPDAPWYCVYTKPGFERATEHRIRAQGHAAWWPMEQARLANRQTVLRGIFPRYLFAQAYDRQVVRTLGGEEIARVMIVPTTRLPAIVPLLAMQTLWAQAAPNGVIYPPAPADPRPADPLRVVKGPFNDMVGICQRTLRNRIWLLIDVMKRPVEISVTLDMVEAA